MLGTSGRYDEGMASIALEQDASQHTPVLGRYRLCSELASGGMATVFLASAGSSNAFSRLVALKRIHAHLAKDPDFIEMFLDEARVASRISHPNVCAVFDFGQLDGSYFIAMEYLMGETFFAVSKRLNRNLGPNWFCYVAEIFAQAGEGLHAAHELRDDEGTSLDVVHRDVSPQNLFLTYAGCTKVVDFGIARCAGRSSHQTQPGTIKGKFAYIAPEQIRCQQVDRRCDVWALGVTLWEMLTGRRLFRGANDLETLQAVLSAPIAPPSTIRGEVPLGLDAIVLRALERDVEARYQTAHELSRALREFIVAHGLLLDHHDVQAWVGGLFEDRQREKQALVAAARETSTIRALESAPGLALISSEMERGIGPRGSASARSSMGAFFASPNPSSNPELPLALSTDSPKIPFFAFISFAAAMSLGALGAFSVGAYLSFGAAESSTARTPTVIVVPAPSPVGAQRVSESPRGASTTNANTIIADGTSASGADGSRYGARGAGSSNVGTRGASASSDAASATGASSVGSTSAAGAPGSPQDTESGARPAVDGAIAESEAEERDEEPSARPGSRWPRARGWRPRGLGAIDAATTQRAAEDSAPSDEVSAVTDALLASERPSSRVVTVAPEPSPPDPAPRVELIRRFPDHVPPSGPISLAASAQIERLEVTASSIPLSAIRRALDRIRSNFEQCYAGAATRARRAVAGIVRVELTIDEMGRAQRVHATGHDLAGLDGCVRSATERVRTQVRPDTGRVSVSFAVQFTPRTR